MAGRLSDPGTLNTSAPESAVIGPSHIVLPIALFLPALAMLDYKLHRLVKLVSDPQSQSVIDRQLHFECQNFLSVICYINVKEIDRVFAVKSFLESALGGPGYE